MIACIVVVASSGCGERTYDGSEFEVSVDGTTETFHSSHQLQECDRQNTELLDNYGLQIGEYDEPGYFSLQIEGNGPGQYRVESNDDIDVEDVEEFRMEFVIDRGSAAIPYDTEPLFCENRATLTIEGKNYGLVHGTASGQICDDEDVKHSFQVEFSFAEGSAGQCPP